MATLTSRMDALEASVQRLVDALTPTPAASSVAAVVAPEKGFPSHLKPVNKCEVDPACKFIARTPARAKIHGPAGHNFTTVNHKAKKATRKARKAN